MAGESGETGAGGGAGRKGPEGPAGRSAFSGVSGDAKPLSALDRLMFDQAPPETPAGVDPMSPAAATAGTGPGAARSAAMPPAPAAPATPAATESGRSPPVAASSGARRPVRQTLRLMLSGKFQEVSPQFQKELSRLRRPETLNTLIDNLPAGSLGRAVAEEFADSFLIQLGVAVAGAIGLALVMFYVMPAMPMHGALQLFYYLGCTLYFCRYSPQFAVGAVMALNVTSFALFSLGLFGGGTPLAAFKPTVLFWVLLMFVGGIGSIMFNEHLYELVQVRMAAQRLERDLRLKQEQEGQLVRVGAQEVQLDLVRQREGEIKELRVHYSTLLLNFQRLCQDLEGEELLRAVWEVMQRGTESEAGEVYRLQDGKLRLVMGFEKTGPPPAPIDGASFEQQLDRRSYRILTPNEHPRPLVELDRDRVPAFYYAIKEGARVVLERDNDNPEIRRLIHEQTDRGHPVRFCYPLADVRKRQIKGLLTVSRSASAELNREQIQILRTISDLSGMAFSHWETMDVLRRERREIYEKFSTYVSPRVVDQIVQNPAYVATRRQKVTVVFVDLRGFTNLSENLDAEVVVELLTDFFSHLTPLIFQFEGTLDKYIGDEIMALWGAPVADPLDARRAVACAWEMQRAFRKVKAIWEPRVKAPLDVGIAINTGEAIIGSIGSKELKNYTAIGDTVNSGARLESVTGRGRIHITRPTHEEVANMVEGTWMPPVRVQGKREAIEYFDLQRVHGDRLTDITAPPPAPPADTTSSPRLVDSRELAQKISMVTGHGVARGKGGDNS